MTGAERVIRVEAEPDAPMRTPAELNQGQQLALERERQRVVPFEQVDTERAPAGDHRIQEAAQVFGEARRHAARTEPRRRLDVPPDDQHLLAGREDGLGQRLEVRVGVDQERDACGVEEALAVPARRQDIARFR
jgi:hypothetical protein